MLTNITQDTFFMNIIFLFLMAMSTMTSLKSQVASEIVRDFCLDKTSKFENCPDLIIAKPVDEKYIESIHYLFGQIYHAINCQLFEQPESLTAVAKIIRIAKQELKNPETKMVYFHSNFALFIFNEILDTYGELITHTNSCGETLLHITAKNNLPEFTINLLARNANINAQDGLGRTPLYLAVINTNLKVIRIFCDSNQVIMYDSLTKYGFTALDNVYITYHKLLKKSVPNENSIQICKNLYSYLKSKGALLQKEKCDEYLKQLFSQVIIK